MTRGGAQAAMPATTTGQRGRAWRVLVGFLVAASAVLAVGVASPVPEVRASTTPGASEIRSNNVFYAYVGAGQNIDINFTKIANIGPGAGSVTAQVQGPGGVTQTCTITRAQAAGTQCNWPNLTSATPGVWQITFLAAQAQRFNWTINVQNGATTVPGRVWSESYNMSQFGSSPATEGRTDVELWYQSEFGYTYQAVYGDFNGIDSNFRADSTGISATGTCESAYRSIQGGGPYADTGYSSPPLNACGDPYKIFFEAPAADLPETATYWDGTTDWVKPPIVAPSVSGFTFAPTNNSTQAGTFEFTTTNFTGQADLQIDANGDGDFTDPEDRTIPAFSDGTTTVPFDGLDGLGNPIPASQAINAQVLIDRAGEIHFTMVDAEVRGGGIEVQRLNGPADGATTIYWDDTGFIGENGARCGATTHPPPDGTAGVDSTGGVHGWDTTPSTIAGCPGTNPGVNGPYGDTRHIDDWAYVPVNVVEPLSIPARTYTIAKSSTPPTGATVLPNGDVVYTVTVTNTGPGALTGVTVSDNLSDIVDDATITSGPTVVAPATGMATIDAANVLTFVGDLPVGTSTTITYTATVNEVPALANELLFNTAYSEESQNCQTPGDPTCSTTHEVVTPALSILKTSTATADSRPGDLIEYTITATNTSGAPFTSTYPAIVVDDMTGLLDDAIYQGDAAADRPPAVDDSALPQLSWVGELPAGESVEITYTALLQGGGDGYVRNVAFQPPCDPSDPGCDPMPPVDCVGGVDPATNLPCDEVEYELPKLTIDKAVSVTEIPALDTPVTYTVTVTNVGPGDYTATEPATFTDDLSDVLDDAAGPTGITATPGTAGMTGATTLGWEGVLTAGQSATITYTVTYTGGGDQVLINQACVPVAEARDPAFPCDATRVPAGEIVQTKTSNPPSGTSLDADDVVTYMLTFQNIGDAPATVDTRDDLTGVLDDATLNPGSPTADPGLSAVVSGPGIDITGTVPVGVTLTVTYSVTVNAFAQQTDHLLRNALACQAGSPPGCAPEVTEHPIRQLAIAKTSNATANARPGDEITYTVTATNIGRGEYTATEPAPVIDDLSGVLDDATYNDNATASPAPPDPTYSALDEQLTWVGPLPAGQSVTITYSVTLIPGGDGSVRNVAFQPPCTPGDPGCDPVTPVDCINGIDPATELPCDPVEFPLPKLTIDKTASETVLPAVGDTLTYTVTVSNPGPGDYTPTLPATFNDDLSDVVDDTTTPTGITATAGVATFVAPSTLSWTGVLTAGQSAMIEYTVTYTGLGDHLVVNNACVPATEAQDPMDPCATITVPGSGLVQSKTAVPPSGTVLEVGDTVTYTLSFQNTGQTDAAVNTTDDLSGVLDDADLTAGPTAEPGLTATPVGDDIAITGTVPVGETLTVTYEVTVKAFPEQNDHILRNALACPDGSPPGCLPQITEHPIKHLSVTKTSDAQPDVDTGDVVTYTVTITNDGAGGYTDVDPGVATDDLTGVIDDAIYNNNAAAPTGAVAYAAPILTWTGALAPGDFVTMSYTVTVTNNGDHVLENTASIPGCDDALCNPPPVVTPLPHVVPGKTSNPASGTELNAGDVVTYTLTWTNDGEAAGVVDSTDDITDILDDGDVTSEPVSDDAAVTATRTGGQIRIVGPIAADDTITVVYQVTIKPDGQRGNNIARNILTPDTPQVDCTTTPCTPVPPPTTQHPIGELTDWKTVDPASGSSVQAGNTVTYTLHFLNTGEAPVDVNREDVLTGILDDATLISGPTASDPALTASGVASGRFTISGTLAVDQEVTVTYAVTVNPDGARGDDLLGNFLVNPGDPPPTECAPVDPLRPDCTVNPVSAVTVVKASNPASGSTVEPGGQITYTLTFTNTSAVGAVPVNYTDHLAGVLDDATVTGVPTSSSAGLNATFDGSAILITGQLAASETATITYIVTLKPYDQQGDHQLNNVVARTGETPVCVPSLCTEHVSQQIIPPTPPVTVPPTMPQPEELPATGGNSTPIGQIAIGLVLLGGLTLALTRRRRRYAHSN